MGGEASITHASLDAFHHVRHDRPIGWFEVGQPVDAGPLVECAHILSPFRIITKPTNARSRAATTSRVAHPSLRRPLTRASRGQHVPPVAGPREPLPT